MPEKEITAEDIVNAAQELLGAISDARLAMLNQLAEVQDKRAARLAGAAAKLQTQLGQDDPQVAALKGEAASAASFKTALQKTAAREARVPKIKQHEWLVFGQVLDPTGKAVSGLRVRVYDRDRKYDDLLGDTTTDEYGDFAAKYHERDFAELGEDLPDLYVMVSDAAGNLLYSSRDHVRYESGRSEYFEIVLGMPPGVSPDDTKVASRKVDKPGKTTAKARSRKRKGG